MELGQHPKEKTDTVTILEKIGHFLDENVLELYHEHKHNADKREISGLIEKNINVENILINSAKKWDGGYVMSGLFGHGDAFALRDPNGIRPAYYYQDDEIVVVASERPVIQTAFNVPFTAVQELDPGHALIVKRNGSTSIRRITEEAEKRSCSFERIYFSRGNDAEIYKERKMLGELVCSKIMKSIDGDINNSVFSFIPNTAETCYYGMVKEMEKILKKQQIQEIMNLGENATEETITEIVERGTRY